MKRILIENIVWITRTIIICLVIFLVIYFNFNYNAIEKDVSKECFACFDNIKTAEPFYYNSQREILHRMFGSDLGTTELKENTQIKADSKYMSQGVTINVRTYDLDYAYKRALEKTDKRIEEERIKDRRDKNSILTDNLKKEIKEIRKEKKFDTLSVKRKGESKFNKFKLKFSLKRESEQRDDTDIFNVIYGGLFKAIDDNPCDYLIIREEYKKYDDVKNMMNVYFRKLDNLKLDKGQEVLKFVAPYSGNTLSEEFNRWGGYSVEFLEDEKRIMLNVWTINYGSIYKNGAKKTNQYISENANLDKKEKEKVFEEMMYEARDKSLLLDRKDVISIDYKVLNDGDESTYIFDVDEQSLYNALLGGMLEAMKEEPLEYWE